MLGSVLAASGCAGLASPSEVVVTAKDFRYQPERIVVPVGQTVRLKLVNSDPVEHDLTTTAPLEIVKPTEGHGHAVASSAAVANASVHLHTDARQSGTVDIRPKEQGTYEVFCTVEGHKAQGMVATLVVQ